MWALCGRPATGAGAAACMCGIAGYWGPHVGYYGGVNYGFGYMGIGFAGGVWAGGAFRYNTAVMRVGHGGVQATRLCRQHDRAQHDDRERYSM